MYEVVIGDSHSLFQSHRPSSCITEEMCIYTAAIKSNSSFFCWCCLLVCFNISLLIPPSKHDTVQLLVQGTVWILRTWAGDGSGDGEGGTSERSLLYFAVGLFVCLFSGRDWLSRLSFPLCLKHEVAITGLFFSYVIACSTVGTHRYTCPHTP